MSTEERISTFKGFMGDLVTDEMIQRLVDGGFFTAPASTKYHGSYEGGLFDHSYAVARILVELTETNELKWENERSPYIVGMFHDLCKMDNYQRMTFVKNVDGGVQRSQTGWEYNNDTLLKGHGVKSVMLLSSYFSLTMEEIAAITYHMGAFTDKEEWRDYTRAVNQYSNVLWTHHADMLASHVMGV